MMIAPAAKVQYLTHDARRFRGEVELGRFGDCVDRVC